MSEADRANFLAHLNDRNATYKEYTAAVIGYDQGTVDTARRILDRVEGVTKELREEYGV